MEPENGHKSIWHGRLRSSKASSSASTQNASVDTQVSLNRAVKTKQSRQQELYDPRMKESIHPNLDPGAKSETEKYIRKALTNKRQKGYIYVFTPEGKQPYKLKDNSYRLVKIGCARDVDKRFKQHQSQCKFTPQKLLVSGEIDLMRSAESLILMEIKKRNLPYLKYFNAQESAELGPSRKVECCLNCGVRHKEFVLLKSIPGDGKYGIDKALAELNQIIVKWCAFVDIWGAQPDKWPQTLPECLIPKVNIEDAWLEESLEEDTLPIVTMDAIEEIQTPRQLETVSLPSSLVEITVLPDPVPSSSRQIQKPIHNRQQNFTAAQVRVGRNPNKEPSNFSSVNFFQNGSKGKQKAAENNTDLEISSITSLSTREDTPSQGSNFSNINHFQKAQKKGNGKQKASSAGTAAPLSATTPNRKNAIIGVQGPSKASSSKSTQAQAHGQLISNTTPDVADQVESNFSNINHFQKARKGAAPLPKTTPNGKNTSIRIQRTSKASASNSPQAQVHHQSVGITTSSTSSAINGSMLSMVEPVVPTKSVLVNKNLNTLFFNGWESGSMNLFINQKLFPPIGKGEGRSRTNLGVDGKENVAVVEVRT